MVRKAAIIALVLGMASFAWAKDNDNDANTSELQNATKVVQHMTNTAPDKGIPNQVLDGAKCVAVIPHLIKGAFVIGGEHGTGVATCRTSSGWSSPAPFSVSGISWGPQVGWQSTNLLMFVMNQQGMDQLLSGHFKVGGSASAVAGPVGRAGSAEAGWKAAILTYSQSKGAFSGASLNGAELQQDNKLTKRLYGRDVPFKDILSGQAQAPNAEAKAFVNAVENAKQSAEARH
jgi:lipid-binding SYLF domain-containing protein